MNQVQQEQLLTQARAEGAAAEREACEKLVESFVQCSSKYCQPCKLARVIAAAIRARGEA